MMRGVIAMFSVGSKRNERRPPVRLPLLTSSFTEPSGWCASIQPGRLE